MITRRSKIPWIHRQSRLMMGVIALFGTIETAYLTWIKWSGGAVACPTQGCNQVLNSPYATVFGLPLPLFGCLAYGTMLLLATIPLLFQSQDTRPKPSMSALNQWTWRLMFALATAMVICSSYLIYLLGFEIQAFCLYCLASALFSVSLFILTIVGYPWDDLGQLGLNGLVISMVALVAILGIYNDASATSVPSQTAADSEITTVSGTQAMKLAAHLQQLDAKMYGAYWCPHCQEQKELFGKQAFAMINYIECDPNGQNAQPQRCQAAGITGYPTWEIQGQFYPGRFSLEKLASLSGYQQ